MKVSKVQIQLTGADILSVINDFLDVDNLIFISKKEGKLEVQSGALEYACSEYSILDIVAQNIDGGLESIKKRWKRYEKTIEIWVWKW